jgi:hypothetical protein
MIALRYIAMWDVPFMHKDNYVMEIGSKGTIFCIRTKPPPPRFIDKAIFINTMHKHSITGNISMDDVWNMKTH